MAKLGLEYYRLDTNRYQDIRIKRLKKEFNTSGIAVYDYILTEIYRVKGSFIMWDESTAFDVADYFGIKETLVREIVNYCCAVGLFNKELLISESILTSKSIQKRYIDMCKAAKRANYTIPEKYIIQEDLLKLTEEMPKIQEETPKLTEENDKEKKRKEKESKEKNIEEREKEFFASCEALNNKFPTQAIKNFFSYWSEKNKSGTKMRWELEKTWELTRRINTWVLNEEKFRKQPQAQPQQLFNVPKSLSR